MNMSPLCSRLTKHKSKQRKQHLKKNNEHGRINIVMLLCEIFVLVCATVCAALILHLEQDPENMKKV